MSSIFFLNSGEDSSLAYGAFPIIFAKTRKRAIAKKKYNLLCYSIKFFVMFLFIILRINLLEPPISFGLVFFSAIGLKTLKNRGVLDGFQPEVSQNAFQERKILTKQMKSDFIANMGISC